MANVHGVPGTALQASPFLVESFQSDCKAGIIGPTIQIIKLGCLRDSPKVIQL